MSDTDKSELRKKLGEIVGVELVKMLDDHRWYANWRTRDEEAEWTKDDFHLIKWDEGQIGTISSGAVDLVHAIEKRLVPLITQQCNQARIEGAKDATQSVIYVLTGSDDFRIEPAVELGFNTGQIMEVRRTLYRMKDAYNAQAKETEER